MMGPWRLALGCTALLAGVGCGEERLLGLSCPPEGCAPLQVGAPYETCVTHEMKSDVIVPPNGSLEYCELFTLDELTSPDGDSDAYLSVVTIDGTPRRDALDLRMAPEVPGFPDDGLVDCGKLLATPTAWVPLATTVGEAGESNLEVAPIVARRSDRLMVRDEFTNTLARGVAPSAKVTLKCATRRPTTVSQPIELIHRLRPPLPPGAKPPVPVRCTFEQPALVTRLYRRTRLTTKFIVRELTAGADVGAAPLWTSDYDWTHELETPAYFAAGDAIAWDCSVVNLGETDITNAVDLADACSLFGLFRVGGDYRAPSPEACVPR
jgi:hypothetical protein